MIQDEVRLMMLDVGRLDERVRKLSSHFAAVQKDVEQVLTSSDKVAKRGDAIGRIRSSEIISSAPLPAPVEDVPSLFEKAD